MSARSLPAARVATAAVFLICGIGMASWAPMVPFVKTRLALNDADLGLILLCFGGGAMVTMPLTGGFINRFGSRKTLLVAVWVLSLALPVLTIAPSAWALAIALFLFGSGIGAVDVAMNVQAVVVEKRMAKPIMSSLHGLFSVGGLVGALGISWLLHTGLSLWTSAIIVSVMGIGLATWQYRYLLPASEDPRLEKGAWIFPRGRVLALGALCFIAFLAEGALLDWSAVYLKFYRGFSEANAGIGYAVFSLTMAIGRLTGDRVAHWLGAAWTLRAGALLATLGYGLLISLPSDGGAMMGFILIGLGIANIVPLLFSAAGRLENPPPSISIPTITTLGYAGLLAGPALIGFGAELSNLPIALGGVGVALLWVAMCARTMTRNSQIE